MPLLIRFYHCLVRLSRVPVITNGVVCYGSSASKLLHCQLTFVLELHVLGSLDQLAKICTLGLQCLVDWVVSTLKDKYVLVYGTILLSLNSYEYH